ncbi:MAG: hypothetical protein ACLRPT_02480 [Akkermansia muciniphila]
MAGVKELPFLTGVTSASWSPSCSPPFWAFRKPLTCSSSWGRTS